MIRGLATSTPTLADLYAEMAADIETATGLHTPPSEASTAPLWTP